MKKILAATLLGLVVPLTALAADVTAEITLILPSTGESYSLNNGSSFDTLTINNASFDFDMSASQSVVLRSADKRNLSNSQSATVVCDPDESRINFGLAAGAASVTLTVTPSGTCVSSAGGGGGGGGGGGSVPPPAPTPTPTPTPAPATTTPATSTPPTTPPSPTPAPTPTPPPAGGSVPAAPAVVFTRDLSLGISGNDVTQLQALLASDPLIYPEGKITGYFGSLTQAAVRKFQAKYGLPAVGRVGPLTRAKLVEVFGQTQAPSATGIAILTMPLQRGSQNDEVTTLQTFLAKDNAIYPEGKITGYLGPLTEAAVKRFQAKYGIEAIGIVGPKTRAKINGLLSQ